MGRWRFLGSILAVGVALIGSATANAQTIKITNKNDIFYAECVADDVVSRCQIDTGDSDLLTVRPDPKFAAYPAVRHSRSMGITGQVALTKVVRIGVFAIGDVSLNGVEASVKGRSDGFSRVGMALFRPMGKATFDFKNGEIRAGWPRNASRCSRPFTLNSGIKVPISVSGRNLDAYWDTGANSTVVSESFVAANPDAFELVTDGQTGLDSHSSSISVRLFRMKQISFCGRDFKDLMVIAIDMSGPTTADPSFPQVMIGANLMVRQRWAFDFADRSWSFD